MINTAGAVSTFRTDGHRCMPFSQPLMNNLCCCCSRSLASSRSKMLSLRQSGSRTVLRVEVIIAHPNWAKTLSNFLVNLTFVFSLFLTFTHTFYFTPYHFLFLHIVLVSEFYYSLYTQGAKHFLIAIHKLSSRNDLSSLLNNTFLNNK